MFILQRMMVLVTWRNSAALGLSPKSRAARGRWNRDTARSKTLMPLASGKREKQPKTCMGKSSCGRVGAIKIHGPTRHEDSRPLRGGGLPTICGRGCNFPQVWGWAKHKASKLLGDRWGTKVWFGRQFNFTSSLNFFHTSCPRTRVQNGGPNPMWERTKCHLSWICESGVLARSWVLVLM